MAAPLLVLTLKVMWYLRSGFEHRSLGILPGRPHFKACAESDSGSLKHRFCARQENQSRRSLPRCMHRPAEFAYARQQLPSQAAKDSTFHKMRELKVCGIAGKTCFSMRQHMLKTPLSHVRRRRECGRGENEKGDAFASPFPAPRRALRLVEQRQNGLRLLVGD